MAQRSHTSSIPSDTAPHTPAMAVALRLFWLLFGNIVLVAGLAFILTRADAASLVAIDLGYWVVVAALLAARRIDITRYHGATADGDPATLSHWRRYALGLVPLSGAAWGAAHWLGTLIDF